MNKILWFAALLAAFGLIMLLSSTASAHPGVERVAIDCHEDEGEDTEHIRTAVAEDKEVDDNDAG